MSHNCSILDLYKYNSFILLKFLDILLLKLNKIFEIFSDFINETFESNFLSVSFLTMEFYKKMESGHIINICSSSANSSGWPGIEYDRLTYNVSKSSLKKFSNMLQSSKNNSVKVSTLEPAQINTKMLKHKSDKVIPLEPSYVVGVIHWILNQPESVVISSMEIQNDSRL